MSVPVIPIILSIKNISAIVYDSTEIVGTVSCDDPSPKTVYTEIGALLESNTVLYTDASLTTPMVFSTFTYGGTQYTTNGSGAILSSLGSLVCLIPITVYMDCNAGGSAIVYPSSINSPLVDGTIIYSNASGTTETGLTTFVYLDGQYNYTPNPGAATEYIGKCRDEYVGTVSCSDGTARTIYVVKDTPLQIGTTLYTDVFLTTTLTATTFLYAGTRYDTNGIGIIANVFVCLGGYTIFSNCELADPLVVFASAPPHIDGTTLYLDADGVSEKSNGGFVYNGANYSYTSGIGTAYSSDCAT